RPEMIETTDPNEAISAGALIDLIAFSPAAPRRFALRCGAATVLGAIEPQYLDPAPVPVHRDVTRWMRSGCRGIVLLRGDEHEARRILGQIARIEAEDDPHAPELGRLLMPPPPQTIVVARRTRRLAA